MSSKKNVFREFPAVDALLKDPQIVNLSDKHNKDFVVFSIRITLNKLKSIAGKTGRPPTFAQIVQAVMETVTDLTSGSLVNVYNATGIVIHTNLGRAPFSNYIIEKSSDVLKGYNNLEFDLLKAKRGSRYTHVTALLRYLTTAEDVLVVNNNAAALMLILRTFAKSKEVIVSRGELIEIGGSFRLPEILAASDCVMKEVGTTNKTRISDYKNNLTENTAVLLKAHRSNYEIKGFTQEAGLEELVSLGKKEKIPVVYDMGSGLFDNNILPFLKDEPDIKTTLKKGVDLVTFSGDKLLGGPQAGIIAGKKEHIALLKKDPMLRALRVGKITLAYLESSCLLYLNKEELFSYSYIYRILNRSKIDVYQNAEKLVSALKSEQISSEAVKSSGQFGGGSLPGKEIQSAAVRLLGVENDSNKHRSGFAEKMYHALLRHEHPVLGVLKQGNLYFDLLSINPADIPEIAKIIVEVYNKIDA